MRSAPPLLVLLAACSGGQPTQSPPALSVEEKANIGDPVACEACHEAVVVEWGESMHARAHQDNDPIYAGIRAIRLEREGVELGRRCDSCHAPRAVLTGRAELGEPGVSCAACHAVAGLRSAEHGRGAAMLAPTEGDLLLGPGDLAKGASDAHGTGPAPPHMKNTNALCLVCHDVMKSAAGVPICTTGPEMAAAPGSCAGCHMPRVPGPTGWADDRADHASHTFAGPHRAWYQGDPEILEAAVAVDGELAGGELVLRLGNRSAHAMPTGFPGRLALVQVIGRDAAGVEVWRAWKDDPMAESPESVLGKLYVDGEGKPTLAPYAARLERDSRLAPGETRELRYALPGSVVRVSVQVLMRLVPPRLARRLGLDDAIEGQARVALEVEIAAVEPGASRD